MPKYIPHLIFNFSILSLLFIIHQYIGYPLTIQQVTVFTVGFIIGTTILTPDIDVRSQPSQKLGIIGYPYRLLTSHRGISHSYLWGTISIVVYLVVVVGLLLGLIFGTQGLDMFIIQLVNHKSDILTIFLGVFISNIFHVVLDKIS